MTDSLCGTIAGVLAFFICGAARQAIRKSLGRIVALGRRPAVTVRVKAHSWIVTSAGILAFRSGARTLEARRDP